MSTVNKKWCGASRQEADRREGNKTGQKIRKSGRMNAEDVVLLYEIVFSHKFYGYYTVFGANLIACGKRGIF